MKKVKCLITKVWASNTVMGITKIRWLFGTDTLNWRVALVDPYSGKSTDYNIHRYSNTMFSAYLDKRKVRRSEIWPKIHILSDVPQVEGYHIGYQKLNQITKLLDEQTMRKIVTYDPMQINTVFIISLFCEDYFKEMVDQYVGKVLVGGKAPNQENEQKMQQLRQKVLQLYWTYYFGEKLTPLEKQIEVSYLSSKQDKYFMYEGFCQRNPSFKQLYRCSWTNQDQRLIENMINWPQFDINLNDINYRSFYEPLQINKKLPYVQKLYHMISTNTFLSDWHFNRKVRKQFHYSVYYMDWIKGKLFSRTIQYTKSLQFVYILKIPPDFLIELSVLNIHIWLIVDRLKEIGTKKCINLSKLMENMFERYVSQLIGNLNLSRVLRTQHNCREMLKVAQKALNFHFNVYRQTRQNPYIDIDALVWSIAFRQKVGRYSDEVYLFSEYLVKNYTNMRNYGQDNFLDAICQFDCYLIQPDYQQKMVRINPRLEKEEFDAEFKSNKYYKKYYYKTNEESRIETLIEDLGIGDSRVVGSSSQRYSFMGNLLRKIFGALKKYIGSADDYDHFSEMEKQKKEAEKASKGSAWEGAKERVEKVEGEFGEVEGLRRNREGLDRKQKQKQEQKRMSDDSGEGSKNK